MRTLTSALLLLMSLAVTAQKRETLLDYQMNTVAEGYNAYYFSVVEPKGDRWRRETFYVRERTLAFAGDFLDSATTIADGTQYWFYANKQLRRQESFARGKHHGVLLHYDDSGHLLDSTWYENGFRKGIGLGWNSEGFQIDSSNFDGGGNGVSVTWYPGGALYAAGRYVRDTARQGKWRYYYEDGKTLADLVYKDGQLESCRCWNESGTERDPEDCQEKMAAFPGGMSGWRRYLEQNLQTPRGVGPGRYVITVRFIVGSDGTTSSFDPITNLGHGFEDEVVRLIRKSPKWIPAQQFGRPVKSYFTQPVTFVISD